MPILGILASSRPAAAATSYESIATVSVGSGGASTVDFTSIPSTYLHLQVRALVKSARANAIDFFNIRVNGTTTTTYNYHGLYGDGTSVGNFNSGGSPGDSKYDLSTYPGASATSIFGVMIMDILDYKNTTTFKTIRQLGNYDANGSGQVQLSSGALRSTDAITSLSFYFGNGNIAQYSHFALYGIKGE